MERRSGLTPVKAIRKKCLWCCLDQPSEVRLCPCKECSLYPYRFGHKPKNAAVPKVNTLKAIRLRCLDCSAYLPSRVRECPICDCVLYPYRLGRNPRRAALGRIENFSLTA